MLRISESMLSILLPIFLNYDIIFIDSRRCKMNKNVVGKSKIVNLAFIIKLKYYILS